MGQVSKVARVIATGGLIAMLLAPAVPSAAAPLAVGVNPPGPPSSTAAVPGLTPITGGVTAGQLAAVAARVGVLTARASAANASLARASAREAVLRMDFDEALLAQQRARQLLAQQVRRAYENYQADPLSSWLAGLSSGDAPAADLAFRNTATATTLALRRLTGARAALAGLAHRLGRLRQRLLGPAVAAETALEQAQGLLSYETALFGQQQALAAQQARLRALSAQVTSLVAVSATPAELATEAAQAPILAALVAAGSGLPSGYAATPVTFTGIASWYGPGFIGNPTASGAPYDPEKLTCAMLAVPLGTVVHVAVGARAVNCLVNDRGPYVAGRIIDMSEAGAASLAYTGIVRVTVSVLAPRG